LAASHGDIFFLDFGPRNDARIEGPHYLVVVQANALNELPNYPLTIVTPISSTGRRSGTHVKLEPESKNGLAHTSFVKCEQILTIAAYRLTDKRGALSLTDLYRVKEALRITLGL